MTSNAAAITLRSIAARPAVRGWLLAAAVYLLAVFHRSSLGVAGLLAEQRFGISAGQLGIFVFLQLGVYAAMQVPTGILVDRYGPRRLLTAAAFLMGVGQLVFAIAPSYPAALFARALLGCGDAMTFISVLRFAAARFSPKRYPTLIALTTTAGVLGNVLATLPLHQLLQNLGWTDTFAGAATLSLLAGAAVWTLLDDSVPLRAARRTRSELRQSLVAVNRRVVAALASPGTRLGFWVHFACMSTTTALAVLWGHPYLVDGVGFSSAGASVVLMVGVLLSGLAGPGVGWLVSRHAPLRVGFALGICTLSVAGWLVTAIVLGDQPSRPFVAALFIFTMLGGPASTIAFSLVRDYNDPRYLGTASGAVNVGGFVAAVIIALVFGTVVSQLGGSSSGHLREALLVPVVVQSFGSWRVIVWLRRVRAHVVWRQRSGLPVPVPVARRYPWDRAWDVDSVDIPVGIGDRG